MGWRITAGKIEMYFDGVKVGEYSDIALTCEYESPFLLWNGNNFMSYDNLIVATADYDLFNEGSASVDTTIATDAPVVDDTTAATDAPVVDDTDAPVVDDTDAPAVDNTDAPAADDTNAPAADNTDAPAADTVGTTGTQKPSTSTGDAMVAVTVLMVLTLGAAILVKKVNA